MAHLWYHPLAPPTGTVRTSQCGIFSFQNEAETPDGADRRSQSISRFRTGVCHSSISADLHAPDTHDGTWNKRDKLMVLTNASTPSRDCSSLPVQSNCSLKVCGSARAGKATCASPQSCARLLRAQPPAPRSQQNKTRHQR